MFVYSRLMELGRVTITFPVEPEGLLERIRARLEQQGAPPVTVGRVADSYVFEGDTAEFMVRARAGEALDAVWPAWRDLARVSHVSSGSTDRV
jgi:hypothetical protein